MTCHTYLDLSTAHLMPETVRVLERFRIVQAFGWPAMTIAPYEYGVFVTVPSPESLCDEASARLPRDLAGVLVYARNLNIDLLRFDADGAMVPGLEVYAW